MNIAGGAALVERATQLEAQLAEIRSQMGGAAAEVATTSLPVPQALPQGTIVTATAEGSVGPGALAMQRNLALSVEQAKTGGNGNPMSAFGSGRTTGKSSTAASSIVAPLSVGSEDMRNLK